MTTPMWMDSAACRSPEYDAEWWFALPGTAEEHTALRVCMGCPVRGECLAWARDTHADYGIFGGLDEQERRGGRASRRLVGLSGQYADIEHIRQLAAAGHSDREIAQALDTTTNRVEHLRRRHHIRPGRAVRTQPHGGPSDEQLSQLIAADRAARPVRETANRLGVTIRTVERWRARLRAEVTP